MKKPSQLNVKVISGKSPAVLKCKQQTMSRVPQGRHFSIFLLLILGVSLVRAAPESVLLSLEDARAAAEEPALSSSRIVGGSPAAPNQFPHQVALLRSGSLTCGGSLIADKWVLTAAHCVVSGNQVVSPSLLSVLAGTVNLNQGGVRRNVLRAIPHERYGNFRNDVALLELVQAFQLSSSVATIALRRSTVPGGSTVTISGWGRLSNGGPLPSTLQYNQATALSAFSCARETGFTTGLICLKSPANNGACNGDSGGPAVYNNEVVGVANFVINGCGTTNADGYAQVSDFVQWIESRVNSGN